MLLYIRLAFARRLILIRQLRAESFSCSRACAVGTFIGPGNFDWDSTAPELEIHHQSCLDSLKPSRFPPSESQLLGSRRMLESGSPNWPSCLKRSHAPLPLPGCPDALMPHFCLLATSGSVVSTPVPCSGHHRGGQAKPRKAPATS
jgi:hypothetical protein